MNIISGIIKSISKNNGIVFGLGGLALGYVIATNKDNILALLNQQQQPQQQQQQQHQQQIQGIAPMVGNNQQPQMVDIYDTMKEDEIIEMPKNQYDPMLMENTIRVNIGGGQLGGVQHGVTEEEIITTFD